MDNLITGLFALAVFLAFVVGLASSIAALPFTIIVGTVCILFLIDFIQSVKNSSNSDGDGK